MRFRGAVKRETKDYTACRHSVRLCIMIMWRKDASLLRSAFRRATGATTMTMHAKYIIKRHDGRKELAGGRGRENKGANAVLYTVWISLESRLAVRSNAHQSRSCSKHDITEPYKRRVRVVSRFRCALASFGRWAKEGSAWSLRVVTAVPPAVERERETTPCGTVPLRFRVFYTCV